MCDYAALNAALHKNEKKKKMLFKRMLDISPSVVQGVRKLGSRGCELMAPTPADKLTDFVFPMAVMATTVYALLDVILWVAKHC